MKKVLSFVLSVAMVICLMPAMAFAADTATGLTQFSDADDINNKEAVAVLVGLGIVDGMGDGTFQPQGDLTRAQAAKLVSTLVKSGDKSDIPAPAEDPFTDVAKDYWGAGAIQFGVEKGYINGMGDGTFVPEGNVTTAQMATMLLKVLGYTVDDVNYKWPENAMGYAQNAGLLEEIDKTAGENLNREEAAQMMYNALLSETVVKSSTTGGNTVEGVTDYSPIVNGFEMDYRDSAEDALEQPDALEQLVEKYFPKVTHVTETTDDLGHESTVWKNGRDEITDAVIEAPTYTYTAAMAAEDLEEDLDGYEFPASYTYNGADADLEEASIEGVAAATGNGTVVELYANDKDTAIEKIIAYDYEPLTVALVDKRSGDITLRVNRTDAAITVTKDDDLYENISSVAKDDIVLGIMQNDELIDVKPAENTKDGALTKIEEKDDSIFVTVGGSSYEVAASADVMSIIDQIGNLSVEGTAYLDDYGYLELFVEAVPTEANPWILVKSVYQTEEETDKYGEVTTPATWYVRGVNNFGDIVDLAIDPDDEETNAWMEELVQPFFPTVAEDNEMPDFLLSYTETENGYYELAEADQTGFSYEGETTEVAKAGAAKLTVSSENGTASDYVSTDVTVITVTGTKAAALQASTSSELPKLNAGTKVIVDAETNLVTAVFVEKDSAADEQTLAYFSAITGFTSYKNAKGKTVEGFQVEYYTADSAEPQVMIVNGDTLNQIGTLPWMTITGSDGDASKVAAVIEDGETEFGVAEAVDDAYNGTVTVNGELFSFTGDDAVRDLRDVEEDYLITTVADLVEYFEELEGATINYAYTVDDDENNIINQFYIED